MRTSHFGFFPVRQYKIRNSLPAFLSSMIMPFGLRMDLTFLVLVALGGGKREFGYFDIAF